MTRIIEAAVCATIGAAFALGCVYAAQPPRSQTLGTATTTIHEDDPRWDCATMGNRICGPLPVDTDHSYEDERWQDPSGYPYCSHPDDGLRPCVDAQTQVVTR